MSEKVGQISTKQWQQFALALRKYAQDKNWALLSQVNSQLGYALRRTQLPNFKETEQEATARRQVAEIHKEVIAELIQAKEALAVEMAQFKGAQEGLAAYQMTSVSGENE